MSNFGNFCKNKNKIKYFFYKLKLFYKKYFKLIYPNLIFKSYLKLILIYKKIKFLYLIPFLSP